MPGERVLILSASIGGGHVSAAKALVEAFSSMDVPARHVDLLEHTILPFRRLYRQAYFDLVRTVPDLVEWLGRRLDRPTEDANLQRRIRARAVRMLSYEVPRIIDAYDPTVVLHTHFLGAEILSGRSRRKRPARRGAPWQSASWRGAPWQGAPWQGVVITDYFAHALWLQPGVSRYYVASGDVEAQLLSAGVAADRVQVTGIPISARFGAAARSFEEADGTHERVLLLASGLDQHHLVHILKQLRALKWPLHVTVVCGRTPQLLKVAQAAVADAAGPVTFEVLGYSDRLPELMAKSTLGITKPGGLTASEALATRLPLMLVSPYPLQEEINANYLLENGCAVRVDPLPTLGHKLKALLDEPGRLETMRAATQRLAKPDAALDVARSVVELMTPSPQAAVSS